MTQQLPILLIGAAVVISGCSLNPEYVRPAAPIPETFPTGPAYAPAHAQPDATAAGNLPWQAFFTDDKLRQVIAMALANNRDLRIAALNVERARAMYGIQRAERLPTINATGVANKQRVPADLSASGNRTTVEQYSVDFGLAAWELDFFGRIRSLSDAALAEYMATEQGRRSEQILLVSSTADSYITLAADCETLSIAQDTLKTRQEAYDLIKRRFDSGISPELDVHRAASQVESARRTTAYLTQQVAQDHNALNLLVGTTVPQELLPENLGGVPGFQEIVADIPSTVLLERPDVLAAEDRLKAANANIGAARAALFPRISLTAALGTASSDLSGLFKSGSGTWIYAPQVVLPIFDSRLRGAAKVSRIDRELAVAQYERAIQTSFSEVADALAVLGTVDRQIAAQESLVQSVSETYRLSNARYVGGIDDYLSVLEAQRSLFSAQQDLVSLRLGKRLNQIRLYAVLGGGWQDM